MNKYNKIDIPFRILLFISISFLPNKDIRQNNNYKIKQPKQSIIIMIIIIL